MLIYLCSTFQGIITYFSLYLEITCAASLVQVIIISWECESLNDGWSKQNLGLLTAPRVHAAPYMQLHIGQRVALEEKPWGHLSQYRVHLGIQPMSGLVY